MAGVNINGLYGDKGYRIRCMQSLKEQIERDHADCIRLWEKMKKGTICIIEEEEFNKIICWLREEIKILKELRKRGIEGTTFGDEEEIENDLKNMNIHIKINKNNKSQ